MIGGAPVSRAYADEIGAEGFAEDCASAVDEATKASERLGGVHRGYEERMMIWQDIVIMVCCFGLGFALLPSVFSKAKPARLTCLMTGVLLAIVTVCFVTLHLWLSAIADALVTILWFILLFQRRER